MWVVSEVWQGVEFFETSNRFPFLVHYPTSILGHNGGLILPKKVLKDATQIKNITGPEA